LFEPPPRTVAMSEIKCVGELNSPTCRPRAVLVSVRSRGLQPYDRPRDKGHSNCALSGFGKPHGDAVVDALNDATRTPSAFIRVSSSPSI